MKKIYYDWHDVESQTQSILQKLHLDCWQPDYVVGITRGGAVPAILISQYLNIPMHTLKVNLRDHVNSESNLWMAEDAFGYVFKELRGESGTEVDPAVRKNILIVDDINDSGATIKWIQQDWQAGCLPNHSAWSAIWHNTTRFATLINNESSLSQVDYHAVNINKMEEDVWIVFPWEQWWSR